MKLEITTCDLCHKAERTTEEESHNMWDCFKVTNGYKQITICDNCFKNKIYGDHNND